MLFASFSKHRRQQARKSTYQR